MAAVWRCLIFRARPEVLSTPRTAHRKSYAASYARWTDGHISSPGNAFVFRRFRSDDQAKAHAQTLTPFDKLDLAFNNGKESYKSKSNFEILRALLVFKLTSFDILVNRNKELMKFARKTLGKTLFKKLMKASFYGQFVAGEDLVTVKPVVRRNLRYGVKAILDYSVEEDLSEAAATQAEMESCVPAAGQDEVKEDDVTLRERFRAHSEFGDRRKNVVSARTYFYEGEAQCERNLETFLRCIDVVADATNQTGFTAVKLTALGRPQLLLQMSHVLVHMKKIFDKFTAEETITALRRIRQESLLETFSGLGLPVSRDETKEWFTWLDSSSKGEVDLYDWSNLLRPNHSLQKLFYVPNLTTGQLEPMFPSLSNEEEEQMKNMLLRVNRLVEHAEKKDIRVMVDAEQTYFQPAINRLTMEMMRKFNREKAIVFNTYQTYLKDAYDTITIDMDLARRENFCFGAKVVRGAYMDQERERARTVGYEDPVNPTFEATSAMYEKVMNEVMLEATKRPLGKVSVMAATHNEDTVRYIVKRMEGYGIHPQHKVICFGQLLGMCDHVSFPLGQSGFSVYKYVPFGPVEEVLPYLSRRALENRGFLKKVQKERALLWGELVRRLSAGEVFYRPPAQTP